MPQVTIDELHRLVGKEIGVSDWITISQQRINAFADCTEDHQFIHVDENQAQTTPFGGTIAHGFLTMSLPLWKRWEGFICCLVWWLWDFL